VEAVVECREFRYLLWRLERQYDVAIALEPFLMLLGTEHALHLLWELEHAI